MFGTGPQRIPRDAETRLLERIKSMETRLAGIERRGSSATYTGVGIVSHAGTHSSAGGDPLTPSDIGAASSSALSSLDTRVTNLETQIAVLPSSYVETITGDSVQDTWVIEHNGLTRDCLVEIREEASPYARLDSGYTLTYNSSTEVTITFATPPGTGVEYRVLVVIL